jgi:hypothetical protein
LEQLLRHLNAGRTDYLPRNCRNRIRVAAERYGALNDSCQCARSLAGSDEQCEGHGLCDMTRGTKALRDSLRGFVSAANFQQAVSYTRVWQLGAREQEQVHWYAACDGGHTDRHHHCKSTGVCLVRVMGDSSDIPNNHAIVSRAGIEQKCERRDSHGRARAGSVFAASAG